MTISDLVDGYADINHEFISSLGAAVYFFSRAEWVSICCCHAIDKEYVYKTGGDEKPSASNVAEKLISLANKKISDSKQKNDLLAAARIFKSLASDERNALLHSYPATFDGVHLLHNAKENKSYNTEALKNYARQSAACSDTLNRIFNEFLRHLE